MENAKSLSLSGKTVEGFNPFAQETSSKDVELSDIDMVFPQISQEFFRVFDCSKVVDVSRIEALLWSVLSQKNADGKLWADVLAVERFQNPLLVSEFISFVAKEFAPLLSIEGIDVVPYSRITKYFQDFPTTLSLD